MVQNKACSSAPSSAKLYLLSKYAEYRKYRRISSPAPDTCVSRKRLERRMRPYWNAHKNYVERESQKRRNFIDFLQNLYIIRGRERVSPTAFSEVSAFIHQCGMPKRNRGGISFHMRVFRRAAVLWKTSRTGGVPPIGWTGLRPRFLLACFCAERDAAVFGE